MHRADQHQRPVIVDSRQAEPAVLPRNLDAEGAKGLQPVDHLVADPRLPLDPMTVDLRLTELAQPRQELFTRTREIRVDVRQRIDEIEPEPAEEQLLAEAGPVPPVLSCFFGCLARPPLVHRPG
jgi:hypothetical protein